MSDNKDKQEPKLGMYLAYGMCFGMLVGAGISLIGTMLDSLFFQIGGFGIGLSLGVIAGAVLYSINNKHS